jgi:soluble lytic murein transglycosylase-like protein
MLEAVPPKDRREGQLDRRQGGTDSTDRRRCLRYVGMGLFCLGLAAPAHAQIYTWRDANGHLVLSNLPNHLAGAPQRTFDVSQAPTVRATRAVIASRNLLYDDLILEHSRLHDVRTDLVRAVVQVESGFNPFARSPKGAAGLMQLMPATALRFGVRNVFSPVENIRAGVAYLRELLNRYSNNEQLALAAYNAGPGAVDKYGQNVPPYRETENYVSRIEQIAPRRVQVQPLGGTIYKTTEIVNGRVIPRYVNHKPADAELVAAR